MHDDYEIEFSDSENKIILKGDSWLGVRMEALYIHFLLAKFAAIVHAKRIYLTLKNAIRKV